MPVHIMTTQERKRAARAWARLGRFHGLMSVDGGFDMSLSRLFRSERFRLGLAIWGEDYRAEWAYHRDYARDRRYV